MKDQVNKRTLSRRQIISGAGSLIVATPFMSMTGCNPITEESASSPSSGSATDSTSTTVTGASEWASGNTSLITVDYPEDTLFDDSSSCSISLTESTTEGPCYFGVSEQEDISEGRTGLPMILCMQLIDEDCNPLEGYLIEIWHCDNAGIYSADTTDSDDTTSWAGSGFCADDDAAAEESKWFRGELTTDSSGRVNFKSCFPGWYSGRTIHIHFRVRQPSGGNDYVISQFCFSDSFAAEICTTHVEYSSRGEQDTPLASGTDTVFPSSGYNDYMLNVEQNSDGTLLAYKRVQIEA